jgi:hypothetical protein
VRRAHQAFGLALALAACSEDAPPAMTVGPVGFTESQLLGLTASRRESLALVTALGLAVSDSTTAALGEPVVEGWLQDRLLEILGAELTLEKYDVGSGTLMDAYRVDPLWELTVEHLLVFSERWRAQAHREAAAAKAARARDLLEAGVDFPEVETRLAEEPGGEARSGQLPPGREGAWVPEFWAAALTLEPGGLSPVTETQYGFHVLRLEGRALVPFPEARSVVARRVARTLESPAAVLDAWMEQRGRDEDARRAAALAEARARALEVPSSERAELERRWEDMTTEWANALGFGVGLSPGQLTETALAALARTGQNADLARRDITAYADAFRARYDIDVGTDGTPLP